MAQQASRKMVLGKITKVDIMCIALDSVIIVAAAYFLVPWFSEFLIESFGYLVAFAVLLFMAMAMTYMFVLFFWLRIPCCKAFSTLRSLIMPTAFGLGPVFAWHANQVLGKLSNTNIGDNVIGGIIVMFMIFQMTTQFILALSLSKCCNGS